MMLRVLPRAAASIAASLALQQSCRSDDRLARWHKRWEGDTRGWELGKTVHPCLAEFEDRLLPDKSSRVLVPLAGASHDIAYLAWRGHSVVAVEGVLAALEAFKEAYGADEARKIAGHGCDDYEGDARQALATMHVVRLPKPDGGRARVTWHAGDFLGNFSCPLVDAAFDRGGLVAVTPADREAYAAVLRQKIRPGGKLLFVSVEHPPFADGRLGPPHSIERAEVDRLLSEHFEIEVLKREDRMPVEPAWRERGCDFFFETTYLLTRRDAPVCDAAGRLMSLS